MTYWNNEKRARFVFFVGLGLLALVTINPYEFFDRLDYREGGWFYSDGWFHILAAALIFIGAWKWLDERSVK